MWCYPPRFRARIQCSCPPDSQPVSLEICTFGPTTLLPTLSPPTLHVLANQKWFLALQRICRNLPHLFSQQTSLTWEQWASKAIVFWGVLQLPPPPPPFLYAEPTGLAGLRLLFRSRAGKNLDVECELEVDRGDSQTQFHKMEDLSFYTALLSRINLAIWWILVKFEKEDGKGGRHLAKSWILVTNASLHICLVLHLGIIWPSAHFCIWSS